MINSVYIDIESPGQAALLSRSDSTYEITETPEGQLCSGYGYFKDIQNENKLVALVAIDGNLYLYLDRLYELSPNGTDASLRSGFFRNEFALYNSGREVLKIKYKPTSYDAGVFEEISNIFSDKKLSALRIDNTIQILSETDPKVRQDVDKKCVEKLRAAKQSRTDPN